MSIVFEIESVVKILPSPAEAQTARYECIWDAGVRKECKEYQRLINSAIG